MISVGAQPGVVCTNVHAFVVSVITPQPNRAALPAIRSPKVAIVVGALVGTLLSVLVDPPHPAQTIVALAAAFGFLAALSLGTRVRRRDWYAVQLMLSLNLAVLAVTEHTSLGIPITALVAASAVGLALVATLQRFRG